ncbi:GNAT family acetyltransferase [Roseibium aggregatum]|uniref:GNAT family acetyltransferase n=1 Tax=Roseibium aggregatum TaxID=187304 RepID=A0A926NXW1_9HYPH|nr:GNAT family acetyltransferase [Roseibium aggregatum]MBD1545748.1 GNAT family acetyltransferase [Roseibium aggregatum]
MPVPTGYSIVEFQEEYRKPVIALWQACGLVRAWNDPDKDIDRKLADRNGGFFVMLYRDPASGTETVIGSVMAGYDGHRGSIYYLSIAPEHQGSGCGRQLMTHCEDYLIDLGCPKINLFVRKDNEQAAAFYEGLGYIIETSLAFGKRLIPDD